MLVAMKGHPGSGKSTLARSLATALQWPLLDKDDVRDCTHPLHLALSHHDAAAAAAEPLLNNMAYQVLWRMAKTQLQMGLSVIVDSPLSRPSLFASAAALAAAYHSQLIIIECVSSDAEIWKHRLESRADALAAASSSSSSSVVKEEGVKSVATVSLQDVHENAGGWHKPRCWEDLQALIYGYEGCYDYEVPMPARKLVVNTTSPSHSLDTLVAAVLQWLHSSPDKGNMPSVSYIP
ncbi:hypothetical protein L7F22_018301 [Adiantum nelumboides]|nr:hypothetical protein [Adiantum nelumboides]